MLETVQPFLCHCCHYWWEWEKVLCRLGGLLTAPWMPMKLDWSVAPVHDVRRESRERRERRGTMGKRGRKESGLGHGSARVPHLGPMKTLEIPHRACRGLNDSVTSVPGHHR